MNQEPQNVGTRDFFWEASENLIKSDTPHFLMSGYEGSSFQYTSHNITTSKGCDWFRDAILKRLAILKEQLLEIELSEEDE